MWSLVICFVHNGLKHISEERLEVKEISERLECYLCFGVEHDSVVQCAGDLLNQFLPDPILKELLGIHLNDTDQRCLHHQDALGEDGD